MQYVFIQDKNLYNFVITNPGQKNQQIAAFVVRD